MKHISLLPPEIKAKRLAKKRQGKLMLVFFVVLVVLVTINAYLLVNSLLLRNNLNALKGDREMTERQVGELREYEDLYQDLNRAERIIGEAIGNEPLWGTLLGNIGQVLPVGTQLADVRMNYIEQNGFLTMTGWTYTHDSLAEMLEQLKTMEELEQVQFRVSAESMLNDREVVQFQLESMILGGPGYFPQEEDGE